MTDMDSSNGNQQQGGGGIPPEKPSPVFTHQVEHQGIVCDNCNKAIFGFRYKCCQCQDYDLCSTCERNGIHAGHVMLRIAFPEMANEAIRSYILKSTRETLSTGFTGAAAPLFEVEHHGRKRHCKRERHFAQPDGANEVPPTFGTQCPVVMGKKEIKKWAKYMRKTAHLHKRMAVEAVGTHSQAQGEACGTGTQAESGANPDQPKAPPPAFDFSAAASQIQEFLNAFGVPIDVVELYDEWGNRGTPQAGQAVAAGSSGANPGQNEKVNVNAEPCTSAPQGDLAENLEKMNLGPAQDMREPEAPNRSASASTSAVVVDNRNQEENVSGRSSLSSGVDVESEAGWTLLEDETNETVEIPTGDTAAADEERSTEEDQNSVPAQIPMVTDETTAANPAAENAENLTSNISEAPANDTNQIPASPSASTHPQISPSLQQVFDGLSTTVGNVVRTFAPWNGSSSGARSPTAAGNGTETELNERMQMTLNQLLSMGFSNHDGWLAKLVASKNGNLEEVLNSLFPVGTTNTST